MWDELWNDFGHQHIYGNRRSDIMLIDDEPLPIDVDGHWMNVQRELLDYHREQMTPQWKRVMKLGIAVGKAPDDFYVTNTLRRLPRQLAQVKPQVLMLYGDNVQSEVFEMFDQPISNLTLIPADDDSAETLKNEYC